MSHHKRSALGTAFEVLQLFERPAIVRLTVGEVAEAVGISKSTASTTLAALADEGYLSRVGDGQAVRYAMGERFLRAFADAFLRERQRLVELKAETVGQVDRVLALFAREAAVLRDTDGERADTRLAPTDGDEADAAGRVPTNDGPSARPAIDMDDSA